MGKMKKGAQSQNWTFNGDGPIKLQRSASSVISAYTKYRAKSVHQVHLFMDCNSSTMKIPMHTRECTFHKPSQTWVMKGDGVVALSPEKQKSGGRAVRWHLLS